MKTIQQIANTNEVVQIFAKKKKKKKYFNLYSPMNIKIVEYSYPIFVISVIYFISVCRDLRHTNDLQDAALGEINKSLSLLMKTNIDSNHNEIQSEIEILNHESLHKQDEDLHQDTMKEDLVSRNTSYGRDVSMIPTHEYNRKSFDAPHRIRNKKRATKEIWTKQQSFPNKSRGVMKRQKSTFEKGFKRLKQKHDYQERDDQLDIINMKNKRYENNFKSEKDLRKINKLSEGIGKKYDVGNRRVKSYMNEATSSTTSCALTKAEIIPPCDDEYDDCSKWILDGYCTNTSMIMSKAAGTNEDRMIENCQKSCDACPPPISLLDSQIHHREYKNIVSTFNVSLDFHTDSYAKDTSWFLFPKDNKDSTFFNSSESVATSRLVKNERHVIQYNCIVSQNHEIQIFDNTESICYNFEVHDSFGDGLCCEYGDGSFSVNINTNSSALKIEDDFDYFSVMKTSFCVDRDSGEIESKGKFITTEEPTHYPYKRWQCKHQPCLCDSKPGLSSNIPENFAFLFQVAVLSGSDKLRDLESAQYKAACWVLYDDPFEYDLADEEIHNRRVQRYILAVFYFATSPEKWKDYSNFLSSRSECDWNYIDIYYRTDGSSCDEYDNVISIDLYENNLNGTIVKELSGLRMLEYLYLRDNNIHGMIPSTLGRLSNLRHLNLRGNDLEGTIPEMIGNLQILSELDLSRNNLSGSIPETIYALTNLEGLFLNDNKISSSISSLIGNPNKLWMLYLSNNMLTGQIPSTIGSLSSLASLQLDNNRLSGSIPSTMGNLTSLDWLYLNNNMLSGPIPSTVGNMTSLAGLYLDNNTLSGSLPESLFDLHYMNNLYLQDNSLTGYVPDEFCDRVLVQADCRNDMFEPDVNCSCCICNDESPIWNGDCADSSIKVVIDHGGSGSSKMLVWSLTNDVTREKVLSDGPYISNEGLQSYKSCNLLSDCFSFNQISPPRHNTNYTIYWNNNSIHNGRFLGYRDNDDINTDDPTQTMLSFSYNDDNPLLTSCYDTILECYEEEQSLILEPNTTEHIMYNEATKISGRSKIKDTSSPQSKALCWLLNNNHYDNKTDISKTGIIQRYVLAILHIMSQDGLFGDDKYLAEKHECDWNGITCKDNNKKIVTGISLSSENDQIINGILIDEIGSLKYLEVLELSQTQLHGTIPQSFSNLWSLEKLDLSGNKISSTMPATLFSQLNKLEHIDLSNNTLSGSINDDIGSNTHIRFLSMRNNSLTGSLPLNKFKHTDLEHLDIGENELSGLDLSLLLKHTNLKSLDISSNFFVGSLLDHTFTSLSQLRYFNASQNDFSGIIPSTFPELSNITHIDLHINKLRGSIPLGIKELQNIQHLNLQGNKLTGSLSSQLNQLKNLDTLVLSHNELKGSIPFDQSKLQKMERLHLHSNKFEGEAPQFSNMTSYITDCGFPSDSLDPVKCTTCNTCCNSDGGCQSKSKEDLSQVYKSLIFMLVIASFIITCYALKDRITSSKYLKSLFEEKVKNWNALMLISDKSVYHFLLIDNKKEWYVAVVCGIFQIATLFLFVHSADMMNDTSDREYFMLCPANSLECENLNKVSPYGIFVFGLILTIWLLRDIIGSVKLMLVSFEKRNIDFFFTSAVVFSVTMLSLWTSIIYIVAIAGKNTDMIKDAVVLLFVVELDERIFQLVESVNPDWVHAIDNNMRNSLVYEGKNLIISSWMNKSSESFVSMSKMIRRRRNDVPPQQDSENEDVVLVRRDSDVSEGFHPHALEGESSVESNP